MHASVSTPAVVAAVASPPPYHFALFPIVFRSVSHALLAVLWWAPLSLQIFNEFNARSLGDKVNVWEGLHTNVIFMAVIIITIGLQIFIVEIGGKFTSTTGLTLESWGWSILMGFGSVPVGIIMRFIPVKEATSSFADYYGLKQTKAHVRVRAL